MDAILALPISHATEEEKPTLNPFSLPGIQAANRENPGLTKRSESFSKQQGQPIGPPLIIQEPLDLILGFETRKELVHPGILQTIIFCQGIAKLGSQFLYHGGSRLEHRHLFQFYALRRHHFIQLDQPV